MLEKYTTGPQNRSIWESMRATGALIVTLSIKTRHGKRPNLGDTSITINCLPIAVWSLDVTEERAKLKQRSDPSSSLLLEIIRIAIARGSLAKITQWKPPIRDKFYVAAVDIGIM